MKIYLGLVRFTLLVSLLSSPLSIAAISTIDDLSFGTIAVVNNDTNSDITINTAGSIIITNHIRVITPGHRGEYVLSSYPAYTQLFTTVSVIQAQTTSPAPGSEQFTLVSIDTAPSVTTDVSGTATVLVGGTFRTSGSGTGQYNDTLYSTSMELSVNY
ncbi:MAG: hypothetical protein ACJAS1_004545 [Oleiphilaceae bacterium]|jgi:hypothetical protein